jgi:outer membrane immunogenic protein
MKKLLLALALTGLGATSAMAADLAARPYSKAPALLAPTSAYNWSGFYVGVNAGAVFSRSSFDMTAAPFFGAAAPFLSADGTTRFNRTGFTGGAQAGYNWQSGAFAYGVEADINYTDAKSSGSITRATVPGLGLGSTILESSRSEWLMTFRPRVGVTSGNALFYVTGGLAVADYSFTQGAVIPNCACGVTGTVSKTKAGWTVGAGIEYAVTPAWSVKGEYLYVDLGSESFNTNLAAGGFPLATFSHDVRLTESIGRFGLNYKWGSPVVARY